MAQTTNKLSARFVASVKTPGLHADGGNLYLLVDQKAHRRWAFIFTYHGRRKEMGLGSTIAVGLADAREKAADARKLLASGVNPIEKRRADKARMAEHTFGTFSTSLIADWEKAWTNPKHRQQWRSTLSTYATAIHDLPLDDITTEHLLTILRPIWMTKAETANRVRSRIERVLDAAKAKGLRVGENPARLRGHLDILLPKRPKLQRGHQPALPYLDAPKFMKALDARDGVAPRCMKFLIATNARERNALEADWSEIDEAMTTWTVQGPLMKGRKLHRVPLNAVAKAAMGERPKGGGLIFPGPRSGRAMSNMAMDMVLRRMNVKGATVHGFRSTFRDWAGDMTEYPRELAEAAIAHEVGNAVERAYRRSNAFEKRKALMKDWSDYLTSQSPAP